MAVMCCGHLALVSLLLGYLRGAGIRNREEPKFRWLRDCDFLVPPSPEPHTQYCPEKEAPPEGHPPFSSPLGQNR